MRASTAALTRAGAILAISLLGAGCGAATTASSSRTSSTRSPEARLISMYGIHTTIELSGGGETLSPLPASFVPHLTAQAALAGLKSGAGYYPGLQSYPSSGLQLAAFSAADVGPQPDPGQPFKPEYVNTPVWFIEYHDVPYEPSGSFVPSGTAIVGNTGTTGGSATASTTSTAVPTADCTLVLDDATDTSIVTVTGSTTTGPTGTT